MSESCDYLHRPPDVPNLSSLPLHPWTGTKAEGREGRREEHLLDSKTTRNPPFLPPSLPPSLGHHQAVRPHGDVRDPGQAHGVLRARHARLPLLQRFGARDEEEVCRPCPPSLPLSIPLSRLTSYFLKIPPFTSLPPSLPLLPQAPHHQLPRRFTLCVDTRHPPLRSRGDSLRCCQQRRPSPLDPADQQ